MRINIFLILAAAFFLTCTQASAASITNEEDPGTVLPAESGALNFNYSPGVSGMYVTEGVTSNEQWFALATYHGGGQSFYGSTSDSSSIYKQPRTSVQTFANVTIPTAPLDLVIVEADPSADPPVVEQKGSADEYWLANKWSK